MPAPAAPEIGQAAPDFSLRGPEGQPVTLSEYRGKKKVVLVFFPAAFSPACSFQLPDLQRRLDEFRRLDAELLGISVDSWHANAAFARQLGIEFPLLSDVHRTASAAYGVLDPERGVSIRSMFVVDRDGRVAHKEVSAAAPDDADHLPSNERALEALRRAE